MLNSCLFLYNSIKLAIEEAEIQKPGADLTICTGAEHLSNGDEGQENSRLCDLETEPVKLIRDQGGKLVEIAVQFCLINPQNRNVLQGFKLVLQQVCFG